MGRVFRPKLYDGWDHLPVRKIGQQELPLPVTCDLGALELSGVELGDFGQKGVGFWRRNVRSHARWVAGGRRVVKASVRHVSTAGPGVLSETDPGRKRTTSHRSAHSPQLPLTMAAVTENINGSSALQWSPGICCEHCIYIHLSHPFSSSGQNSTPSWNRSLPLTYSSPSFPYVSRLPQLNRLYLSEDWPHLREMIKYKIQKVC